MAGEILVPMDDSEPAWSALEHTLSIHPDVSITVLHVLNIGKSHTSGGGMGAVFSGEELIGRRQREQAEALLAQATEVAKNEGRELRTETMEGQPATRIVTYAENQEVDQIVIGSHGRTGVKRLLLGSVAEAVVRRSSIPVTVVRDFDRR